MTCAWPSRALANESVCLDGGASKQVESQCRGQDKSRASFAALCGLFSVHFQRLIHCAKASQPNTPAGTLDDFPFINSYLNASRHSAEFPGEA